MLLKETNPKLKKKLGLLSNLNKERFRTPKSQALLGQLLPNNLLNILSIEVKQLSGLCIERTTVPGLWI